MLPAITPLPSATVTRQLALIEEARRRRREGEEVEGPVEALLGTVAAGVWTEHKWRTRSPRTRRRRDRGLGDLQHHRGRTPDAHPRDRLRGGQPPGPRLNAEGEVVRPIQLDGDAPRRAWETGFKDTVIAYPGQVTRVRASSRPRASSSGTATSSSTRTTR